MNFQKSLRAPLVLFLAIIVALVRASTVPDACEVDQETAGHYELNAPWWKQPSGRAVVALNNTVERLDFNNTIFEVLQELGAEVFNLTALGAQEQVSALEKSHSYWGLHIYNLEQLKRLPTNLVVNTVWSARAIFGDKDGLTILAKQARAELGFGEADFSPDSYMLPNDLTAFTARVRESPDDLYMRKRLNTHSGSGVKLSTASAIFEDFQEREKRCEGGQQGDPSDCEQDRVIVAQKYVEDPILLYGHKFDVRWWFLITNLQPLRVYMLRDGYAKIAVSARYDVNDYESKCAHVTNNAVQKQCLKRLRNGHLSPIFANFNPSIRSDDFTRAIYPVDPQELYTGAQTVMRKVLRASSWRLEAERQLRKLDIIPYQLLAIDVIYERNSARPLLIEINTNGYLQTGILKIPEGRERLKDIFRMTGTVGFPISDVAKAMELAENDVEEARRILEEQYKGGWERLEVVL
jgi:hypothetical protein